MHTNTHTQHDEHVQDRYWRNLGIYRSKRFETEEEARDFWYTLQFCQAVQDLTLNGVAT